MSAILTSILAFLAKYLGMPIVKIIVIFILEKIIEYIRTQQKLKKIKKTVKERKKQIKEIPNAQARAKVLKDYLRSPNL